MSENQHSNELRPLSAHDFLIEANSPVLQSESVDEFDRLLAALKQDIKPTGFIEEMYVVDICNLLWEILRLRRCKREIINQAIYRELCLHIKKKLGDPDSENSKSGKIAKVACDLAKSWFTNGNIKPEIAKLVEGWMSRIPRLKRKCSIIFCMFSSRSISC